jgi:hypothetical protein
VPYPNGWREPDRHLHCSSSTEHIPQGIIMNRRKFLPASAAASNSPLLAAAQTHLAHAGVLPCHLGTPEAGHWVLNIDKHAIDVNGRAVVMVAPPTQTIATLRKTMTKTAKQPPQLSGPEYAGSAELESFRKTQRLVDRLTKEKVNDT